MLAVIPSPSKGEWNVGPLTLRAYGLLMALAVVAAARLAIRRWTARGGDSADILAVAWWAVPLGFVGARLYHVATSWGDYADEPARIPQVWHGGLGVWGGVAAGTVTGAVVARRRGLPVLALLDVVAPALPVAQAIGRLGNWFNQELYGRPTSLPWALRIDQPHRPVAGSPISTYHPTFLYELLWNLALAGLLLLVENRRRLSPGVLFALYVAGYTSGRLWIETLRVDPANTVLGVRLNVVTSAVLLALSTIAALVLTRRGRTRTGDASA